LTGLSDFFSFQKKKQHSATYLVSIKESVMLHFSRVTQQAILLLLLQSAAGADMPGPDGEELWHHISAVSPYATWSSWGDYQGVRQGNAPHSPFHRVYVNREGLTSKSFPVNFGTIIVKENISTTGRPTALTVMYKIQNFNPSDGDWFWAKYSPEGITESAGVLKGCIGCHSSVQENDYIFLRRLRLK
jgi:hypothetical protein